MKHNKKAEFEYSELVRWLIFLILAAVIIFIITLFRDRINDAFNLLFDFIKFR